MAAFRGVSITFAVVAAIIGTIALFSSPAFTIDWWFSSHGGTWNEWTAECGLAGFEMTCRSLEEGPHYLDYLCDYAAYFQYFPEDWDDCHYIAK